MDRDYWRNLDVNVDVLWDERLDVQLESLRVFITGLDPMLLRRVLQALWATDAWTDGLLQTEGAMDLVCLKDFSDRHTRQITRLFEIQADPAPHPFVQAVEAFTNDIANLKAVLMYESWNRRKSTAALVAHEGIRLESVLGLFGPDEAGNPVGTNLGSELRLEDPQGREYRLYCWHQLGNRLTCQFMRFLEDRIIADFDGNLRNKAVAPVLMLFDCQSGYLEIRTSVKKARRAAIAALSNLLGVELVEAVDMDPIADYESVQFYRGFAEPEMSNDVKVTEIRFTRSLLQPYPELALRAPKRDVRPACQRLLESEVIAIQNPMDVASMALSVGRSHVRITPTVVDGGALLLKCDIGRVRDAGKQARIAEFVQNAFGLPLNRAIDPARFESGRAVIADVLFTYENEHQVLPFQSTIYQDMAGRGLINRQAAAQYGCTNEDCEWSDATPVGACPICGEPVVQVEDLVTISPDENAIRQTVVEAFRGAGWRLAAGDIQQTVMGVQFRFLAFVPPEELNERLRVARTYRLLVAVCDTPVNATMVERLQRLVEPICLIKVGANRIAEHTAELAQLSTITAGQILTTTTTELRDYLSQLFEAQLKRFDQLVSSAARRVSVTLPNVLTEPPARYNNDFERDVFALMKFIWPSAAKWGGQFIPEGFLSYRYGAGGEIEARTYTWDCKYSSHTDGYSLGMDEKDKAARYIREANAAATVAEYSAYLTGHIFISNKFREQQLEGVSRLIYSMTPGWLGKVVFLDVEALLEIYRAVSGLVSMHGTATALVYGDIDELFRNNTAHAYRHVTKPEVQSWWRERQQTLMALAANPDPVRRRIEQLQYQAAGAAAAAMPG